jgi:hypothetical protein
MTGRFPRLAATLVFGSLTLAGCGGDDTSPVELNMVRLAIVPGAQHGGAPFTTDMTTEIRHTPAEYAGDIDGTGTALITVNVGQGEVCWLLTVEDILLPASAAHIHKAAPGVMGGISVFLSAPDATGESSGCTTIENKALLKEIVQSPELFYVNVHNSTYPSGAVRGQLGE